MSMASLSISCPCHRTPTGEYILKRLQRSLRRGSRFDFGKALFDGIQLGL